jgi:hypothetical protein
MKFYAKGGFQSFFRNGEEYQPLRLMSSLDDERTLTNETGWRSEKVASRERQNGAASRENVTSNYYRA